MKTLSYFLILICLSAMSCSNAPEQQVIITTPFISALSSGTNATLNGAFFEDASKGYIVGDSGTLITTSDGGFTWNKVSLSTTKSLTCYFVNDGIHYLGGESFIASGNSPSTLASASINKKDDIGRATSFIKVSNKIHCYGGFTVTNSTYGRCLVQNTGTVIWERPQINFNLVGILGKPVVLTDNSVLVPTPIVIDLGPTLMGNVIYRLNSENWEIDTVWKRSGSIGISALSRYSNSSTIVGVGRIKTIYSSNNGNTWQEQPTPNNAILTDIAMISETIGFACGEGGVLLATYDGGQSWSALQSGTTKNLHKRL